jgi:hypothetical protein
MDERRFILRAVDCEAITDEFGLVDWHGLFSCKRVDLCVYLFYDVKWSYFEKCVPPANLNALFPKTSVGDERTEWIKNKTPKASKKMKESEWRCMVDDDISECDCERL